MQRVFYFTYSKGLTLILMFDMDQVETNNSTWIFQKSEIYNHFGFSFSPRLLVLFKKKLI